MIRPLLAAAAVLAVAAPSAAAHGGGAPDAEIFATNNTAIITDSNDPRLDDRLYRFADRVDDIIRDGGGKPRGSELLDGVFFDGSSLTFERSRRFDVDRVSDVELFDIAETVRRRFLQGSVLTFDHLDRKDPDVNAIELDVPKVSAKALQQGLVKDPEAAARLFGGSVTQDKHLLLVAALEDADLARSFAKKIGGDIKRASTSYGEREFVSADTDGRARIEKRTLVITGTENDDVILLREKGRRISIDFKADGVVDFEPSQRRFDRIRVEGGDGNDILAFGGTKRADDFDLTKDRLQLADVENVDVAGGDGEDTVTIDNLTAGPDAMTVTVGVDLGADGVVDRVVANGTNERDSMSVGGFGGTVYVIGPTYVDIAAADRFDRLRVNGRDGDDDINASTDQMRLTLDGGNGGGTLFGGPGDDVLIGGDGFDETNGGKGDDVARMRGYFDRFTWRAGDGNDDVDGGASHDSINLNGSNDMEVFDFFRFGHSVRFVHDPNAEAVDFEDVEEVNLAAFMGEDYLGIRDLAGTGVDLIDVHLTPFGGGADGDKAADHIQLEATDGDDDLTVTGKKVLSAGLVTVDGMEAKLVLHAAEAAFDSLAIDTLGGDDHVDSTGLEPGVIQFQSD